MHISLLASLREGTGNNVTAERIQSMLTFDDHTCNLLDTNKLTEQEIASYHEHNKVDLYFGIHAFRAGRLLIKQEQIPFIIIFGGTDINEHINQEDKKEIMEEACKKAKYLICFTEAIKQKAIKNFNNIKSEKLKIISPSIFPPNFELANNSLSNYCKNQPISCNNFKELIGIRQTDKLFILPCGIRPVKDPLFLVNCFLHNNQNNDDIQSYLLIVGPILDDGYFKLLELQIKDNKNVIYYPNLQQNIFYGALLECESSVNSSLSEGLSNALLESLYLKVPIIARNIEGNRNVIIHEFNGLLYDTPDEFFECAKKLEDIHFRKQIIDNGYQYVHSNHSVTSETTGYQQLVLEFLE